MLVTTLGIAVAAAVAFGLGITILIGTREGETWVGVGWIIGSACLAYIVGWVVKYRAR